MMSTNINLVAVLIGTVSGAIAGGLVLAGSKIRRGREAEPDTSSEVGSRSNDEFDALATEWAGRLGRPGAAPIVAAKMRLADELGRRQRSDRRMR